MTTEQLNEPETCNTPLSLPTASPRGASSSDNLPSFPEVKSPRPATPPVENTMMPASAFASASASLSTSPSSSSSSSASNPSLASSLVEKPSLPPPPLPPLSQPSTTTSLSSGDSSTRLARRDTIATPLPPASSSPTSGWARGAVKSNREYHPPGPASPLGRKEGPVPSRRSGSLIISRQPQPQPQPQPPPPATSVSRMMVSSPGPGPVVERVAVPPRPFTAMNIPSPAFSTTSTSHHGSPSTTERVPVPPRPQFLNTSGRGSPLFSPTRGPRGKGGTLPADFKPV